MIILKDDYSEKVRYDYPDYPIYIRKDILSAFPNYAAPSHWHDDFEFVTILSGQMQYQVNGEIVTLNQGEGIFINSRQMHFGFSDTQTECEFICVLLHPQLICTTPAYERDFVLPLINHSELPFLHLRADIPWQNAVCRQIRNIFAVRNSSSAQLKIQIFLLTIWTFLYENVPPSKKARPQNNDLMTTKNMVGFIQKNYMNKISLSDIAASGLVGQSKCCKLFSKYLGRTPNMYLNQYRLNKSMGLLKNTDKTITEIANEVGFGGGSYYAEIFRKWVGLSPTEYRKHSAE